MCQQSAMVAAMTRAKRVPSPSVRDPLGGRGPMAPCRAAAGCARAPEGPSRRPRRGCSTRIPLSSAHGPRVRPSAPICHPWAAGARCGTGLEGCVQDDRLRGPQPARPGAASRPHALLPEAVWPAAALDLKAAAVLVWPWKRGCWLRGGWAASGGGPGPRLGEPVSGDREGSCHMPHLDMLRCVMLTSDLAGRIAQRQTPRPGILAAPARGLLLGQILEILADVCAPARPWAARASQPRLSPGPGLGRLCGANPVCARCDVQLCRHRCAQRRAPGPRPSRTPLGPAGCWGKRACQRRLAWPASAPPARESSHGEDNSCGGARRLPTGTPPRLPQHACVWARARRRRQLVCAPHVLRTGDQVRIIEAHAIPAAEPFPVKRTHPCMQDRVFLSTQLSTPFPPSELSLLLPTMADQIKK